MELLDWISDQLTVLAEAFGETLTEQRLEIYCSGLADIEKSQLKIAFRRACLELKWFPKVAELRDLAGRSLELGQDGRPGPEEAWARMPKGERIEQDSIVWSEEERIAYAACRSLLMDGDHIGARMAFKECYEKQLANARSQGRPVQWSMSAGYDIEHRLATLATAVGEKKLTLKGALNFIPEERQNDFARMLPSSEAGHLLTGQIDRTPELPGLQGVLAKMQMQGTIPDGIEGPRPSYRKSPADRSDDECRQLREKAREQAEFLRRSRIQP